MRVLILGFSVLNGLVERFSGNRDGIHYSIRALGGNHFEIYPFLIDWILERENPDLVLLDMVSTPRLERWTSDYFQSNIEFIVSRCHSVKAKVAFLNLYRSDVDHENDTLNVCVRNIADQIGARVLDSLKQHESDGANISELYPDGNHPSLLGRKILGDMIDTFCREDHKEQEFVSIPSEMIERRPTAITFSGNQSFSRDGFNERLLPLRSERRTIVHFPEGFSLCAALMLMGPKTGSVRFEYAGIERDAMVYDSFCYYQRLRQFHLPEKETNDLTLIQSASLPDIKLKKGEADTSKRVGGLLACLGFLKI